MQIQQDSMQVKTEECQEKSKKARRFKRQVSVVPGFLMKTFEILDYQHYQKIISWNEAGDAFIVRKINDFSEFILPRFFKHSNFASFVRQLNMYDFHKTRNDQNENEFKHNMFLRGHKNLLSQIKRKSVEQITPQNSIQQSLMVKMSNSEKQFPQFNELVNEMAALANKQSDLERLIKIIIKQNEKSQKENKYLWNELMKNKQKTESYQERLLVWFLQTLAQPGKTSNVKKASKVINGLLMLNENEPRKQENQKQQKPQSGNNFLKLFGPSFQSVDSKDQIETTLQNLTKKQLLQGLFQAFNFQKQHKRTIKDILLSKRFDDDDSSPNSELDLGHSSFPYEEENFHPPKQKKVKIEIGEQPQQAQKNQMIIYQDNKVSNLLAQYSGVMSDNSSKQSPTRRFALFRQDSLSHHEIMREDQSLDPQQDYLRNDYSNTNFFVRKDSANSLFHVDLNMDNQYGDFQL